MRRVVVAVASPLLFLSLSPASPLRVGFARPDPSSSPSTPNPAVSSPLQENAAISPET